jgi:hypothetical protein
MTTSFLVAIIILPILLLASMGLILTVVADWDGFQWFTFTAGVMGAIGVVVGGLVGLYPYDMSYHSWQTKQGVVMKISSRLVAADQGGSSEKFVVVFRGNPQQFAINDTRAALVKPGQHLKLACIRRHQWGGGVDGYNCRWDQ